MIQSENVDFEPQILDRLELISILHMIVWTWIFSMLTVSSLLVPGVPVSSENNVHLA